MLIGWAKEKNRHQCVCLCVWKSRREKITKILKFFLLWVIFLSDNLWLVKFTRFLCYKNINDTCGYFFFLNFPRRIIWKFPEDVCSSKNMPVHRFLSFPFFFLFFFFFLVIGILINCDNFNITTDTRFRRCVRLDFVIYLMLIDIHINRFRNAYSFISDDFNRMYYIFPFLFLMIIKNQNKKKFILDCVRDQYCKVHYYWSIKKIIVIL